VEKIAERIERLARLHNIKAIAYPIDNEKAIKVVIFERKKTAEDFKYFLEEEVDMYSQIEIVRVVNIIWRLLFKILPKSFILSILTDKEGEK
jgi:hypothetical protein